MSAELTVRVRQIQKKLLKHIIGHCEAYTNLDLTLRFYLKICVTMTTVNICCCTQLQLKHTDYLNPVAAF